MSDDPWTACMRRGDFAAAWAISDRLLPTGTADAWQRPRHLQQVWRGQPLDGQRVLVRCYHGLGDTLQFVRYMPMLRAVAREVTVWVQPALLPLVASVPGIDRLLPLHDGRLDVPFDVDVEIMELPHVFRSTEDTLPREVPYLSVPLPPSRRSATPAIALGWRAGTWDPRRSLPAGAAAVMIDGFGGAIEVLHETLLADEREHFSAAPPRRSLVELAQLMVACDLVITVDTMYAHLAGALGRPVWLLLHADADWRWMQNRDDSPWYPSARLFRQRRAGDWEPVVQRVRDALQNWHEVTIRRLSPAPPASGAARPGSPTA